MCPGHQEWARSEAVAQLIDLVQEVYPAALDSHLKGLENPQPLCSGMSSDTAVIGGGADEAPSDSRAGVVYVLKLGFGAQELKAEVPVPAVIM